VVFPEPYVFKNQTHCMLGVCQDMQLSSDWAFDQAGVFKEEQLEGMLPNSSFVLETISR
jgi:hypothetical protein